MMFVNSFTHSACLWKAFTKRWLLLLSPPAIHFYLKKTKKQSEIQDQIAEGFLDSDFWKVKEKLPSVGKYKKMNAQTSLPTLME